MRQLRTRTISRRTISQLNTTAPCKNRTIYSRLKTYLPPYISALPLSAPLPIRPSLSTIPTRPSRDFLAPISPTHTPHPAVSNSQRASHTTCTLTSDTAGRRANTAGTVGMVNSRLRVSRSYCCTYDLRARVSMLPSSRGGWGSLLSTAAKSVSRAVARSTVIEEYAGSTYTLVRRMSQRGPADGRRGYLHTVVHTGCG